VHRRFVFMTFKLPTWRSVCREPDSLRFHLWRHSHSVRVRWRRGVVLGAAEVGVAQAALPALAVERAAQPAPQATQADL
jgi:hypothetical protein